MMQLVDAAQPEQTVFVSSRLDPMKYDDHVTETLEAVVFASVLVVMFVFKVVESSLFVFLRR
jgi:hypothetical protein